MTPLPSRARAVVIGGGITGTSVAYHLAQAGWRDTVLLEKADLTSGSTCHAAGLVTQFNPSPTMMRFRRYSIELYRQLGIVATVGSLRFASSREQLMEQQRGASRARAIGLDVEVVSPEQAAQLMPAISKDSLFGAVWVPGDGALDPHTATFALAKAARELGVKVLTDTRATGLELSSRGAVQAVQTERGRIEAEVVVIACGIWAPQVAAMAGAFVVSTPVDHQHAALRAVEGAELPPNMPCFRDPDNLIYGKAEAGGVVLGGYELNPNARWIDGVPWEHAGTSVTPDQRRFEPLLKGAARRFPFMSEAGIVKLVCHPDAMTPDANPLLGPVPGIRGLFIAAGLSLNGFGGAGGRRSAPLRLDPTAMVRVAGRGTSRVPRAGGDHRHDIVRKDRAGGSRSAPAARTCLRQSDCQAGRQCCLHAAPRPAWRDGRRCNHHTARPASIQMRHRSRRGEQR